MKLKSLAKGLLVTAAFALTIVTTPVSSAKASEDTYTVEKDDCLRKIAKKVYGDEELWKVIYDANSGAVKSNYIIYSGQVLTIPAVNNTSALSVATPTPAPAATTPTQTATAPAAATTDQTTTAVPAATTSAPAAATTDQTTTAPAAATTAQTTTAPAPAATTPDQSMSQEFVLDYNEIASWIDGGFVGTTAAGEAVIFATNTSDDYGIIIFADDSTMTAASFMGPITYTDTYITITDEANGLALTFTVAEVGDGVLALDMGNLGTATIAAQVKETVLSFVKLAIDGYTHIA